MPSRTKSISVKLLLYPRFAVYRLLITVEMSARVRRVYQVRTNMSKADTLSLVGASARDIRSKYIEARLLTRNSAETTVLRVGGGGTRNPVYLTSLSPTINNTAVLVATGAMHWDFAAWVRWVMTSSRLGIHVYLVYRECTHTYNNINTSMTSIPGTRMFVTRHLHLYVYSYWFARTAAGQQANFKSKGLVAINS